MNICLDLTPLIQDQYTGVHRATLGFAKAISDLASANLKVTLFALQPRQKSNTIKVLFPNPSPHLKIKTLSLPSKVFRQVSPIWQTIGFPHIEYIVGHQDIFHSFDWFAFKSKCPQTIHIYDLTTDLHPDWHSKENLRVQDNRLHYGLKRSQHIFTISQSTKNDLVNLRKLKANNITVVYPGLSLLPNNSLDQNISSQVKNIVSTYKNNYFLFLGGDNPRKNLNLLLSAYEKLSLEAKSLYPLIVVSQVNFENLQLKQSSHILYLATTSDHELTLLYKNALALVYPSLYEGFGLPILEALSCNCPVISSNTSSMPEVAGQTAIYFDPYNQAELTTAIQRTIKNPPKNKTAFKQQAAIQLDKFSYQKSAKIMVDKWKEMK